MSISEMVQQAKSLAQRSPEQKSGIARRSNYVSLNTSIEAGNLLVGNYAWREEVQALLKAVSHDLVNPDGTAKRTFLFLVLNLDKRRNITGDCKVFTVPLEDQDLTANHCRNLMSQLSSGENGVSLGEVSGDMTCPDCFMWEATLAIFADRTFVDTITPQSIHCQNLFKILVGALYPTQDYVIAVVGNYSEDEDAGRTGFFKTCGVLEATLTESGDVRLVDCETDEAGTIWRK